MTRLDSCLLPQRYFHTLFIQFTISPCQIFLISLHRDRFTTQHNKVFYRDLYLNAYVYYHSTTYPFDRYGHSPPRLRMTVPNSPSPVCLGSLKVFRPSNLIITCWQNCMYMCYRFVTHCIHSTIGFSTRL